MLMDNFGYINNNYHDDDKVCDNTDDDTHLWGWEQNKLLTCYRKFEVSKDGKTISRGCGFK